MTLHERRIRANLTQAELAALIGAAQPTIASLESGKRKISDAMALRLATALKCRVADIANSADSELRGKIARPRAQMGRPREWLASATVRLDTLVPPNVAAAWHDPAYKRQIEALADLHQPKPL